MEIKNNNGFSISVKKLYALLNLKYKAVGVKIIMNKEEYERINTPEIKNSINYCGAVRAATTGRSVKLSKGKFRCKSAERIFGIEKEDPLNSNGENWYKLGMYEYIKIAREIRKSQKTLDSSYGLLIMPIEKFDEVPDVVLIFDNPYNVMRIIQGYTYKYGEPKNGRTIGNQAVCYETTMIPYYSKEINISLLCIGTRHRSNWSVNDMSVGITGEKFSDVVEGIEKTMNIMEDDENKNRIVEKYKEYELGDIYVRYGYNYYMDC